MRIWSLHPKYLDAKGLVALWRESLLAKHVLEGRTKGYKSHPQLNRFKKCKNPVNAINQYLDAVYQEALARGYSFDKKKIKYGFRKIKMTVHSGQLEYETTHLLRKLKKRDPGKYKTFKNKERFDLHPIFRKIKGPVEDWEITD